MCMFGSKFLSAYENEGVKVLLCVAVITKFLFVLCFVTDVQHTSLQLWEPFACPAPKLWGESGGGGERLHIFRIHSTQWTSSSAPSPGDPPGSHQGQRVHGARGEWWEDRRRWRGHGAIAGGSFIEWQCICWWASGYIQPNTRHSTAYSTSCCHPHWAGQLHPRTQVDQSDPPDYQCRPHAWDHSPGHAPWGTFHCWRRGVD